MSVDPVSQELRDVEREVDAYHKQHSFVHLPFSSAVSHLLTVSEYVALSSLTLKQSIHGYNTSCKYQSLWLRYPLRWLSAMCHAGGRTPSSYDVALCAAGWELLDIGRNYLGFEAAFTYASRELVGLALQDSMVVLSSPGVFRDPRYDIYDVLAETVDLRKQVDPDLLDPLMKSIRIRGDRYQTTPRDMKRLSEALGPLWETSFSLPDCWQFSVASIRDFREVWKALACIAYAHVAVRTEVLGKGLCPESLGASLLVQSPDALVQKLARYSGIPVPVVERLFTLLTYGEGGVKSTDPILQPLVKLNETQYVLPCSLVMASVPERNFAALLNRIPEEQSTYSRLVSHKEEVMRTRIQQNLQLTNVRFFAGKIPTIENLPDIDLAVISDIERVCLILELKWFIAPDEIREMIEKSKEIEKGIHQLGRLSAALHANPQLFLERLSIDSSYHVRFAVVSANFIGLSSIQNPAVPVVRESHLIKKTNSLGSLRSVAQWLEQRNYLPVEGKHFSRTEQISTVGKWSVRLPGFQLLIEDEYL